MSETKIKKYAWPYIYQHRTYIDIGAHDGDTSVPFQDQFERVIAFEPNPRTYDQLAQHKKIQAHNVALSDQPGTLTLKIPLQTGNPQHGSTAPIRQELWDDTMDFVVEARTLDSYNFVNVDFIKIDVEQGEWQVVQGALNTIKQNLPTIMFENKRKENDRIIDLLYSFNYKMKHKNPNDTIMAAN